MQCLSIIILKKYQIAIVFAVDTNDKGGNKFNTALKYHDLILTKTPHFDLYVVKLYN